LKRIFPTHDYDKNSVKFPTIQHRLNCSDCDVFTIAFATLLLFNIKPDKVKYEHKLMCLHLIKIFKTNIIEHISQDPQYNIRKVLPSAIIKAKKLQRFVYVQYVNIIRNKKNQIN